MSTNPSKTGGQFHSMKGSAEETLGRVTGSTNLEQSGAQERTEGQAQYDAARAKGYTEGTGDRITGKKDSVVGAMTGDRSQQVAGDARQQKGETQQDINRNL